MLELLWNNETLPAGPLRSSTGREHHAHPNG